MRTCGPVVLQVNHYSNSALFVQKLLRELISSYCASWLVASTLEIVKRTMARDMVTFKAMKVG
jgi:hypothetical protein